VTRVRARTHRFDGPAAAPASGVLDCDQEVQTNLIVSSSVLLATLAPALQTGRGDRFTQEPRPSAMTVTLRTSPPRRSARRGTAAGGVEFQVHFAITNHGLPAMSRTS